MNLLLYFVHDVKRSTLLKIVRWIQLVCVVYVQKIIQRKTALHYQGCKLFTKEPMDLQLSQPKENLGNHEHQVCFLTHIHNLTIICHGVSGKIWMISPLQIRLGHKTGGIIHMDLCPNSHIPCLMHTTLHLHHIKFPTYAVSSTSCVAECTTSSKSTTSATPNTKPTKTPFVHVG